MKKRVALAGLGVAATGGAVYAALSAQSQLFGSVVVAGRDPDEIALTYDDGPNPRATPELLDLLAAHNVRATFFMIGRYVPGQVNLVRRVAAGGHSIGNHTMTHPWLAWQSERRIRQELQTCNAALEDATGTTVTLFRPPHGARRPAVFRAAEELGLTTVNWNIMPKDWMPLPVKVLDSRIEHRLSLNRGIGRGSNLLLHDGSDKEQNADRHGTIETTRVFLRRHEQARFVTPEAWLTEIRSSPVNARLRH